MGESNYRMKDTALLDCPSQEFKNSPTSFGNVLAKELELWQNDHDAVTLLQYVDDLLIGSDSYEACLEATISLLNFLDLAGYRVSKKKAQTEPEKKVQHMGFEITKGQKELSTERKEAICRIAVPTSKKQGVLEWTPECRKSFDEIKRKLIEAPAPGKKQAVAATATLIEESWKSTLGQLITVFVPHAVSSLLENKGHHWISPSRLAKYQAVLLEQDDVTPTRQKLLAQRVVTSLTSALNPVTLLLISESGELHHDCLTTTEQVYSNKPLPNAELELFTDGSSFMLEGRWKAGYAVVTRTRALESKSLPSNTSAQKAELVALTRALELSQGKRVNIYTDSEYAFGVVHTHGAIWKERGL
ncbi:hypothetical protein QYF61_002954 [Mycteria americana]|uniref:ribonuclease H n=1 Tax=Mycteria americana TaxID=33587 RepID=A0AAN7PN05_MYCAM|nr:hypothetical protein QYF61_002954 [Mycteria americana]